MIDNKPQAQWVHKQTFNLNEEQAGEFAVSAKGAVKVSIYNHDGSPEQLFCVPSSTAQRMIDNAIINVPGLEEYLASPAFAQLLEQKQVNKVQSKLEMQKIRKAQQLTGTLQATIEQLKSLGVNLKVG